MMHWEGGTSPSPTGTHRSGSGPHDRRTIAVHRQVRLGSDSTEGGMRLFGKSFLVSCAGIVTMVAACSGGGDDGGSSGGSSPTDDAGNDGAPIGDDAGNASDGNPATDANTSDADAGSG